MNLLYKFLFIFSLLQRIYSLEFPKGKEYTKSRRRRDSDIVLNVKKAGTIRSS